nr:hypothetical protein [Bacillus sp. FDAARGOS_1420]
MVNNKLTIKVTADTSEVLKQMKEVTESANECVGAWEKLEKVMGKFRNQSNTGVLHIKVPILLNGKAITRSVHEPIHDMEMNPEIQSKIDKLGLLLVDDFIYNKYCVPFEKKKGDKKHEKYYKWYGRTPMFFTEKYLMEFTIEELLQKDKSNHEMFCPSYFEKNKIARKKVERIQKKIEEVLLSMNEARILQGLEPIELDPCNQFFKKLEEKKKEIKGYKETIRHLPGLSRVIEALEKLNKEYTITKRTEIYGKNDKHPRIESAWDVEEKI